METWRDVSFYETTERQKQLEVRPRSTITVWARVFPGGQEAGVRQSEQDCRVTLGTHLKNNIAAESILPSADQRWPQDAMAF